MNKIAYADRKTRQDTKELMSIKKKLITEFFMNQPRNPYIKKKFMIKVSPVFSVASFRPFASSHM